MKNFSPAPSCAASLPVLALASLLVISSNVSVSHGSPSPDQLFINYLDSWIRLLNRALDSLPPDALSPTCGHHVRHLIEQAGLNQMWALKMIDAIGKPTSGIMEASLSFLGSYSECLETRAPATVSGEMLSEIEAAPHDTVLFAGRYCMASVQLPNKAISALQKLSGLSPSVLTSTHPRIGLCVPSTCNAKETQRLANYALSLVLDNSTLTVANCYEDKNDFSSDYAAHVVIYILGAILLPIFIGTAYDICRTQNHSTSNNNCKDFLSPAMHQCRPRTMTGTSVSSLVTSRSCSSEAGNVMNARLRLAQILLAFSIKSNAAKILNTDENALSIGVLHGLRVLMMLWIIGGHSYSFAMQWLFFQNPQEMQAAPKNILSQVIANGTFSVDSFFFISGLLVTLMGLKTLRRSRGKFNLVYYYVHRYIRMTPLMMAVIGFCATLLRYAGEGPGWRESITMFDGWCRENWWINSLYLHNFVNRSNMCLSHSWYSAVDMQLYMVAPIVIIPLYRKPKLGFFIMGCLLFASMAVTGYLTITRHFPAVPYINDLIPQAIVNEYYGAIYIKPYTRIGPYLVGMALGFVLYTLDGKLRLTKNQCRIGWTLAVLLNLGVLFAMAPANMGYLPSDALAALYSATSRTIWAMSLAWVTYACIAGKGGFINSLLSWKFWVPLSRLTYCAYLIHPVVMACFYGSRQTTFEFSHFLMLYMTLGNLVVTYVLSFILSALFESPIVALEKLFLRKLASGAR